MTYQLVANSDKIKMTDDNGIVYWIPADPANSDWRKYQAWLAEGNEPEPVE
jgi:hypothetical protein